MMLESIVAFDREWFMTVHHFRNDVLDVVMPWVTNRWIWIPFYVFLAGWLYSKLKAGVVVPLLSAAVIILVSDQGANVMKKNFARPRPCHDTVTLSMGTITTPNGCGGPYGFVSGHAANSFALATLMWIYARRIGSERRYLWLLMFIWAAVVAWSRIYMGVHYPLDVFFGGIWGVMSATGIFYRVEYLIKKRKRA